MSEINQQLTRYLLGDVSEEEEIEIELSLFEDEVYEEFQLAEDDLVTNYVRKKLTPRELELFEKNYLKESPERIQKVLFSKAILGGVQKKAALEIPPSQITPHRNPWLHWISSLFPKYAYAFLIGTIFGALILPVITYFSNFKPGSDISQTEKVKQLESDLIAERNKTDELQKENQTLQQQKQQLTEELAKTKPTPKTLTNKSEELVANPPQPTPSISQQIPPNSEAYPSVGITMGGNEEETFSINKNVSVVTINLLVGQNSIKDYKKFRVLLKSEPELKTETNKIVNRKGNQYVQVTLPANRLMIGGNEIYLYGINNEGGEIEIEGYNLRVKKN